MGAPFIFANRKELVRPFGLLQAVGVTAGMGAITAIGIPAGEVDAEHAAPGVRDTEGAVDKDLYFAVDPFFNGADLGQGKFPGQVEAADSLIQPETAAFHIGDIGLGGEMDIHGRHHMAGNPENAGIGDDQAVNSNTLEKGQVVFQPVQVLVMGQDIDGDIDLDPALMGKADAFGHFLMAEIGGMGPEPQVLTGQINSICPVMDGGLQFFQVAGRGQEFADFFWFMAGHQLTECAGKWLI